MTSKNINQYLQQNELSFLRSTNETNIRELALIIWQGKWVVFFITLIFAIASVIYAINLPNIYKSSALLAPVNSEESHGGLAALASQFGGLASIAGINLSGGSDTKATTAIEIMKSRQFIYKFISTHKILPELMALKEWNMANNSLEFDESLYHPQKKQWVRDVSLPFLPKPSMQEAYAAFMKILTIDKSASSGMITISIESVSPHLAQQWVTWLIEDINKVMKQRDVVEANNSIEFLENQLNKTSVADIRSVIYKLIEEQAKTIMFANVRKEYIFKTIDPAIVPLLKDQPKRALICILGSLAGCFLAVMIILLKYFLKTKSYQNDNI